MGLPKIQLPNKDGVDAPEPAYNVDILDVICPMEGFDFAPYRATVDGKKAYDPAVYQVGGLFRQTLACSNNPSLCDLGWGTPLFKIKNSITTITCEPYDKARLMKDIDRQSSRRKFQMQQGSTSSNEAKWSQDIDHTQTMLAMLGDDDERFFNTSVMSTLFCADEVALARDVQHTKDTLSGYSISMETIGHNQQPAFLAASPLMVEDDTIVSQTAKPVPISTLGAMLPFSKAGLDDGHGTFIGEDALGGPIRLDMLTPSASRANRNVAVLGTSGVGKTTTMSKIMLDEVARGTLVIVIDPEREFRYMCEQLHGQWINLGGKSDARICPTQPRTSGSSADSVEGNAAIYRATADGEVLSETVSFLRTFFQIAFELTRKEVDYLEKVFKEEYARYGITYETAMKDIDLDSYPVMDDLLNAVQRKTEAATGAAAEDLRVLAGKLWPAVEGSFANLWNEKTNIEAKSNFIVLDTHELNSRDTAIKSAQYFNLLSWVWDQICSARISGKNIRVVIDECHLVLNEEMRSAAQFVSMIAKRIRKYGGGLMCATQQIADLDKDFGLAVLDQSAYKFLLSTDGINLAKEQEVFHLTEDNVAKLSEGAVGQGVLIAGKDRVWAKVDFSEQEAHYTKPERKKA